MPRFRMLFWLSACVLLLLTPFAAHPSRGATSVSITDQEFVRNGGFDLKLTGWGVRGSGTGVGAASGPDGSPALELQGLLEQNADAFQEIYLPTTTSAATLAFDYRLAPNSGGLGQLFVRLVTDTDTLYSRNLTGIISIDTGWQSASLPLDSADVSALQTAHAGGKAVFLQFVLGQNTGAAFTAYIDNVSLKISGERVAPSFTGELAFIGQDAGGYAETVNRINPNGLQPKQTIWTHPGTIPQTRDIFDVAWSPDATEVAFVSNHESGYSLFHSDAYAVAPDGSNLRRITNPPAKADIDAGKYPMGTVTGRILNRGNTGQTVLLYLEGAQEFHSISLGAFDGETSFSIPNVADLGPGVQQFFAFRYSSGNNADCIQHVVSPPVDVVAGQTVDVGTALVFDGGCGRYNLSHLTWNADGSLLGFLLGLLPRQVKASGEGLGQDLLPGVTGASSLAWSPTNDQILYNQAFGSGESIFLTSAGGGQGTRQEADANASEGNPAWLPDGSGFVFTLGLLALSGDRIGVMNPNSNSYVQLAQFFNEQVQNLTVSPDGNYIAFERTSVDGSRRDIWVMNRNNPVEMWPVTTDGRSVNPDWSRTTPKTPGATATPTATHTPAPPTATPTATATAAPGSTATSTPTPTAVVTPAAFIYIPDVRR